MAEDRIAEAAHLQCLAALRAYWAALGAEFGDEVDDGEVTSKKSVLLK